MFLRADPENAASCRVAEKAGFTREGVLRSAHWNPRLGRRQDWAIYSLLPAEPAIDFITVLYGRYVDERNRGTEMPPAIRTMISTTLPGVFVAAITTAGTFFAFLAIESSCVWHALITGGHSIGAARPSHPKTGSGAHCAASRHFAISGGAGPPVAQSSSSTVCTTGILVAPLS